MFHVLTDRPLADWLVSRFDGAVFPHPITIYHYDHPGGTLTQIGALRAPNEGMHPAAQKAAGG